MFRPVGRLKLKRSPIGKNRLHRLKMLRRSVLRVPLDPFFIFTFSFLSLFPSLPTLFAKFVQRDTRSFACEHHCLFSITTDNVVVAKSDEHRCFRCFCLKKLETLQGTPCKGTPTVIPSTWWNSETIWRDVPFSFFFVFVFLASVT